MSNGALTGMIKQNYRNKLLTKQSDWIKMFWAVFLKETVDSIEWNRSGREFQALGPDNEKARSPKIVRSLGRMYREVEAERRPLRVAWSATSCTVSLSGHCGWDALSNTIWTESLTPLEANAVDVDGKKFWDAITRTQIQYHTCSSILNTLKSSNRRFR